MTESESTPLVEKLAKMESQDMDFDIDYAFNHPAIETLVEQEHEAVSVDQIKERSEKANVVKDAPPETPITYLDGEVKGGTEVENSHQYGKLLTKGYQKLREEGIGNFKDYTDEDIEAEVLDILEHEYQHAVPGLGLEDNNGDEHLNITYGLRFVKDRDSDLMGIQPYIKKEGVTTLLRDYDMLTNPDNLSAGDLAEVTE